MKKLFKVDFRTLREEFVHADSPQDAVNIMASQLLGRQHRVLVICEPNPTYRADGTVAPPERNLIVRDAGYLAPEIEKVVGREDRIKLIPMGE